VCLHSCWDFIAYEGDGRAHFDVKDWGGINWTDIFLRASRVPGMDMAGPLRPDPKLKADSPELEKRASDLIVKSWDCISSSAVQMPRANKRGQESAGNNGVDFYQQNCYPLSSDVGAQRNWAMLTVRCNR
jgi:hypothetical protein